MLSAFQHSIDKLTVRLEEETKLKEQKVSFTRHDSTRVDYIIDCPMSIFITGEVLVHYLANDMFMYHLYIDERILLFLAGKMYYSAPKLVLRKAIMISTLCDTPVHCKYEIRSCECSKCGMCLTF